MMAILYSKDLEFCGTLTKQKKNIDYMYFETEFDYVYKRSI